MSLCFAYRHVSTLFVMLTLWVWKHLFKLQVRKPEQLWGLRGKDRWGRFHRSLTRPTATKLGTSSAEKRTINFVTLTLVSTQIHTALTRGVCPWLPTKHPGMLRMHILIWRRIPSYIVTVDNRSAHCNVIRYSLTVALQVLSLLLGNRYTIMINFTNRHVTSIHA